MNVFVNGILGVIEWEGHRKSRTDNGPRVVIVYQTNFVDSDAFADSVMGGIVVTGGGGGTVSNLPRQTCPTNPRLYALSAEVVYSGERADGPAVNGAAPGSIGSPAFDTARVMVEYGLLSWPQSAADDPGGQQSFPGGPYLFTECEIDFATEQRTAPVGSVVFKNNPSTPPKDPPSFRTKVMAWRLVRHQFPSLPVNQVGNLSGCVNNSTFLGQPRGCVLFDNGRSVATMAPDGTKTQSFQVQLLVKPRDWNMDLLPNSLTWDYLVSATDPTVPLYPYADLSGLTN